MDFVNVTVDNRAVPATVYIGYPTDREAEAVALIHVPGVGNYVFNFDNEKYREASNYEFVRFYVGAWIFKTMRAGRFGEPLPSRNMNQLRIASSNGHTVIVQF